MAGFTAGATAKADMLLESSDSDLGLVCASYDRYMGRT